MNAPKLVSLVLAGALIISALLPSTVLGVQAAEVSGKVLAVAGSLKVNGKAAKPGIIVHRGDRLATGPQTKVYVGFSNGTVVQLGPDSRLMVSDLGQKMGIMLESGGILSAVRPGAEYTVNSSRVVAAVRGTIFYVEYSPMKPNYVCVCRGRAEIRAAAAGSERRLVSTKTHTAFLVSPHQFERNTLWGHTDAEIKQLLSYQEKAQRTP